MKNDIKDLNKAIELLFGKEYDAFTKLERNNYKEILFLIDRYYDFFFLCLQNEGKFPPYRLEEMEGYTYPVYKYESQTCKIRSTDWCLLLSFSYEKDGTHFIDNYSIYEKEKRITYQQYNCMKGTSKEVSIDYPNDGSIKISRDGDIKTYTYGSYNMSISGIESAVSNLEYNDFLIKRKTKK